MAGQMGSPRSVEDILAQQDEVLREYARRHEQQRQWLAGQRQLPSFSRADSPPQPPPDSPGEDTDAAPTPRADGAQKPVHEQLLEKGRLYEQRKEALREEAVRRELGTLRQTPSISASAKSRETRVAFVERSQAHELSRQKTLAAARETHSQTDTKYTFQPRVTRRARNTAPRVQTSGSGTSAWTSKRQARVEDLKGRLRIEELAEMRPGPVINDRSERLVQRRRAKETRDGGASRGPFYTHADSLLERDRLSKLQLWEKYQQELDEQQPGNPKITPYAAGLNRSHLGTACQRLYDMSYDRQERRTALAMRKMSSDDMECYHSPVITANAAAIRREVPVEDDLLRRHDDARARKEEQMRSAVDSERELHAPVINPVSDQIASRLSTTARERLCSARQDHSLLKHEQQQEQRASASHPPSSRRRSLSAGAAQRHSDPLGRFYLKVKRQQEEADKRLQSLRKEHLTKEMEECTFTPATEGQGRRADPYGVVERGEKWQRRRQQKLELEQRRREEKEVAACTFAPRTGAMRDSEPPQSWQQPAADPYGDGRARGYDDFVERHREARRRQAEKEDGAFVTGKGWRNEVTVPREFRLGSSQDPAGRRTVRALQKALSPPPAAAWEDEQDDDAGTPHHEPSPLGSANWDRLPPTLPQPGMFSTHGSAAYTAPQLAAGFG
eukprot:TRINITY_DN35896_c0_g1_i1.p1 TRINITY_DN35896_c0_g1~~TRINITY_DN35896_c0_g1_i1.p1  ORF type:complete len:688 (+),score=276.90 TRINITY_DN35896_c0_g1_i1:48-2066(+)